MPPKKKQTTRGRGRGGGKSKKAKTDHEETKYLREKMASGKLRNLYEDNEHYNKAFLLYDRLGDRNGTMERWCQSVFQDEVIPKLNVNIPDGEELRTLGVGSGTGELECHMLRQLRQKFPRITNHVVEPSTELNAKYQAHISETNNGDLEGIEYNWHPQILQDFKEKRESEADETKFHFISAIHSLYYFDDLGKWLDYLHSLLVEGGVLIVFLTSDSSGLGNIMKEFPKLGSKKNFGFSDVDISHVRGHFDKAGIAHHDLSIPIRVDMTTSFAEEPSTEGDLLIDFASHSIGFRKNSEEELRTKFLQFLDSDKCTEKRNGHIYFKGDWGVTIVHN